ncbi:MAG TPA: hypothetical protein VKA84_05535 [Gemmatimonadaceae bacterium]|nr:hypothetical protein [Gemmatimonadaceae bacterium]
MRTPVLAALLLLTLPALACASRSAAPAPAQSSLISDGCAGAAEIGRRADDSLRLAQMVLPSGSYVLARFYIDAAGRPEVATFEVISTSDSRLIKKTRKLVAEKRYRPYEPMPGCPVRGLVVQSFTFPTREPPPR